ncbi:uncharacterized protein CANTADRAFT_90781 [Suhomyces tanzawaensis NRRL Y-17324]|uniref:DCG1-like protein n=1 Tax=Suhomyces tanzawaensis NRRL Y-17324 TaxID=984487 RepID=A0A1E4SFZ1_9ASCO|nr:uncharacterized protein CANTADRAFT_90781 [Suhomyces tanzawaensis NRRL Y-17324]ODV78433.1 hypothetical protein CANTADRAFT_90781 [Suhomyces tanzawaensis NRRL Y-17324]
MANFLSPFNPNSSESVSANLAKILVAPPNVKFHFYTAPADAPKEISGHETSILSEQVVLPDLLSKDVLSKYDGFLIGCYSDHPLIHSLGKHTHKPILGIMQATLLYSLLNPSVTKLFVLTSFNEWEQLLDRGITDFVGNPTDVFPFGKFQRTQALDISVLSLSDPSEYAKIETRVNEVLQLYKDDAINCVLLGCAGMAGLDEKLAASFPGVLFVDSCKIGVELLTSLVRFAKK